MLRRQNSNVSSLLSPHCPNYSLTHNSNVHFFEYKIESSGKTWLPAISSKNNMLELEKTNKEIWILPSLFAVTGKVKIPL